MVSRSTHIRELELCNPAAFGDLVLTCPSPPITSSRVHRRSRRVVNKVAKSMAPPRLRTISEQCEKLPENEKRRASALVDQLLLEIYSNLSGHYTDYNSGTSTKSHRHLNVGLALAHLKDKDGEELKTLIGYLESHVVRFGSILVRQLKRRDALRRQRDARGDVITYHLRKRVPEFLPEMRFSIDPLPGDSGFSQWHSAMKMVSQLPEGIPAEFRKRLWLALADRHLSAKGINWSSVERNCFSEWSHPTDSELGVQIVKDLHRTGCSLFCGKDGQENQALLKRVLLAYARWNKAVGYCQGFNMLAALILQVTEKCEADALKLMIYLIEGVLPDSYFADSLRGLSVDMAVFRELLRSKLPRLSRHLDTLQVASKEGTTSYEPPLTNVFTMQWFLTLFCNCLPQPTVLRIWDLILLEGNEILLRTALAIWQVLAERILAARSADEFYCVMGMLMREILEFDLIDANTLIKGIVTIGPLTELSNLREHYLYNINPWGGSLPVADKDRRMKLYHKDRLVLDIGVLKKQYTKLKERQRQAHIIFNTAVARQTSRPAPVAMNHLLLGKSALVPAKRLGPPRGAIPPVRHHKPPKTLHWKDTKRESSSSSSSDTELCDDPDNHSDDEDDTKCTQLPDDNLKKSSDNSTLMTTYNTNNINSCAIVETIESVNNIPQNLLDFETKVKETEFQLEFDPIEFSQKLDEVNQIKITSDIFDTETANDLINNVNEFKVQSQSTSDLYNLNEYEVDTTSDLFDLNIIKIKTEATNTFNDEKTEIIAETVTTNNLYAFDVPNESTSDLYDLNNFNMETQSDLNTFTIESDLGNDFKTEADTASILFDINQFKERSNSLQSEDGFDFEKFLEDRVRSLKENSFPSEESIDDTSEQDRIKYARKNSVRALEIIQENSLILHRILQCQSRLSPSPSPSPSPEDLYNVADTSYNISADLAIENSDFLPPLSPISPIQESTNLISADHDITPTNNYTITSMFDTDNLEVMYGDDTENVLRNTSPTKQEIDKIANTHFSYDYNIFTDTKTSPDLYVGNEIRINDCDPNMVSNIVEPIKETNFTVKENDELNKSLSNDFVCKYDYLEKEITRSNKTFEEVTPMTECNENKRESEIAAVDYNLEKYRVKLDAVLPEEETQDDLIEIDKNSKYNSILEYSRDLDEKFNNLIIKSGSPKMQDRFNKHYSLDTPEPEIRHEATKVSVSYTDFLNTFTKSDYIHESATKLDDSYAEKFKISPVVECVDSEVNSDFKSLEIPEDIEESDIYSTSSTSKSGTDSFRSHKSLNMETLGESPSLKSPNRIYNPFPVNISSRQNKDVALRLGLYKK